MVNIHAPFPFEHTLSELSWASPIKINSYLQILTIHITPSDGRVNKDSQIYEPYENHPNTSKYELHAGGVERGTLEVGKYLVEQGHESIVISNGGRLVPQLEAEGSRHIRMPVHEKRLGSLSQIKPLRRLFEREKPDILHLRSRLPAWLAYLAWRKLDPSTRPRLITTVHGFYSVNRYSKIMTCGEQVICVSNSVRDYVLKHYPDVPAEKLTVIHRGVDPQAFPYGYQPPASLAQTMAKRLSRTARKVPSSHCPAGSRAGKVRLISYKSWHNSKPEDCPSKAF